MPLQTNYSFTQSSILSDVQQQGEDGLLDYIGYGTTAAVLSGATGLVNTVIGIGETLGIADSESYLDEGRVVTTVLGQEGGDFYLRHKEGIDFAGMILSSIVPGAAGVKALRMAQKSGVIFDPLKYSTSLKNADILLDSPLVNKAKQAALSNRSTTLLNPEYLSAVGAGFKQQVLENVAFTAGTVLLNNQNATLNPDDLSYLDAAGSQLVEGLPFIGVGAALGTAVDALRIGGSVKKFVKDAQNKVVYTTPEGKQVTAGALRNLNVPELKGRNNGDAIIALAADSNARKQIASNITVTDGNGADIVPEEFQYAYNNIMDSRNILNNEFMKITQQANNAGEDGFALLKGLFDDLSNAKSDRKNVLAGLDKVDYITQGAVKKVDETAILQRKVWDRRAEDILKTGEVNEANLVAMADTDLLAIATRLARNSSVVPEKLVKETNKRFASVLKEVDPKLAKLYGSPLNALSRDADRLLKQELIDDTLHSAIVQYRSTAFVNAVTKEVRNKITPRISDFGATKLVKSADFKTAQLYSPALGKTFKYSPTAFKEATTGNFIGMPEQLPKLQQLDVNFHIAHSIPVDYTKKALEINSEDIGQLERVFRDISKDSKAVAALDQNRLLLNGATATRQGIVSALIESKSKLIANLQKNGFNSDDIAVAANVSEKAVLGEEPLNAASVVARTDFSKPEWLQVQYKERTLQDYSKDINDFTGQAQRDKLYETQKQMALQELGHGSWLQGLPTIRTDAVDELTTLEDRTRLLKRMEASFGSVRETAMYIGKQVNDQIRKIKQGVAEDYTAVQQKFNKPENGVLRAELELATNFLRTGDATLIGNRLVYKNELMKAVNEVGDEVDNIDEVIDTMPEGTWVSMGDDVTEVMNMWQKQQRDSMHTRTVLAEAYGTTKTYDPTILRAPAVDLRQYRIVAFVRPVGGKKSQDPTKYMLYAQSQEELAAKVATVRRDLGEDYVVVQKGDDAEYYKAMQEYEMGHEFRDLFADISKENRGRTADVLPPLGGDQSRALNDMISSTLRNREYSLRASVELQNAESLERLRRYGDYVDSTEKGALVKNFTSRASHIYTDTVALMLDLPSYKGQGMQLWNEVNTAVAQRGSKIVDFVSAQGTVIGEAVRGINRLYQRAVGKESTPKFTQDLQKQVADINEMMQKNGFKTPLKDITDLVLQSSDPAVSSSLQDLSRSMSNLISLTLLRADPAHSFMQLTSSVVLSLPVLRELRKALPDVADKMTTVVHPTTGIKEPNIHKLYFKGVARAFSSDPVNVQFREQLKERGIISDYIGQFLDTTDMSGFTGAHSLKQVQQKQSKITEFISKYSGHTASEEHARFALASAVRDMCQARGIPEKDMWPIISNAVDKVHGNYIASQRPQLFNGVIGQNVGLFQTYFFNVMQHMTKHIANGDKKSLALMGALQSSMFGAQSIPGFNTLNALVANATGEDSDLYSITDANDPNSWSAYGMFGLASQAFGIDFSGRGNLNPRYATIVPTSFENLATVGTLTGAIGNLYKTAGLLAEDNVSVADAIAHGLAHNGMNRPLQGLGTILQNAVTSNTGQVDIANANIDPVGNIAWGSMFARLIGARPMDEAIVRSHFYRQASYDAAHRDKMAELGAVLQAGEVEDWGSFANDYAEAGGDLQQFNAFIVRNMQTASEGKLGKFRQEVEADNSLSRAITRMQLRDSLTPYWAD